MHPPSHSKASTKQVQDVTAAVRPGPSSALLTELGAAEDLRAFAYSALARPAEGGYFYARHIASRCGLNFATIRRIHAESIATEIARSGTVSPHQLAAGDDLPRRCASFGAEDVAQILEKVQLEPGASQDPLIAAERQARSALNSKDPDALRRAFAVLQEVNDPLLWTENLLHHRFAGLDPEARKVGGIYFDGKVVTHDEGLPYLETKLALNLGFCRPGLPCALDYQVQMNCLFSGQCVADRFELIKAQYFAGGGSDAGWVRVLSLQNKIRAAVSGGHASMFVR